MSSHGLLLRLFLSPTFFNVHVALQYLAIYADNIGITYYLTRRLRELDTPDLREVWSFICHLLVTRPSKSRALECFVVEIAQRSTHIAMLTLWFMQATLKDLSGARHDSYSFLVCQRILHKCHEIIFSDLSDNQAPYVSLSGPLASRLRRKKVKPHVEAAVVGIGLVLVGAPALPELNAVLGEVAIEQGRLDEQGFELGGIARPEDDTTLEESPTLDSDDSSPIEDSGQDSQGHRFDSPRNSVSSFSRNDARPSLNRTRLDGSQTVPALPLHLQTARRSRLSEDPLGQLDSGPMQSPYQSSPSISSSRFPPRSASIALSDMILQTYDMPSQVQLLRSHYCRSEVQFILSLENISNRLLVVPKPARVSALRAELTALNHRLPAEVCMPMWCSSSDKPQHKGHPEPHHRIVRVPPGESVVLNSAERAPYLLLLEILNDDLDFDPSRRSNKDLLKRIVVKGDDKGNGKHETAFTSPTSNMFTTNPGAESGDNVLEETMPSISGVLDSVTSPMPNDDSGEMDLVEQVYGEDVHLHAGDFSESFVLPTAPKNRDLDLVAWSSTPVSSFPPSPAPTATRAFPSPPDPISASPSADSMTSSAQQLSLDEYSQRMRTAAIMLAQLNANLVQNTSGAHKGDRKLQSLGWIPGSRWLSSSDNSNAPQDQQQGPAGRMGLQPSEAAAIRDRIMQEMMALENERVERMKDNRELETQTSLAGRQNTAEDEGIIRRELNREDPSAVVFSESWATKKSRVRQNSPYGHLVNWDCISVIVKTGGDLRQEQLATQLIRQFQQIWEIENCSCWVKPFRILITGGTSGLIETLTDSVSIHSLKKAEYARRMATGGLGHVTLLDHFVKTYGDKSSARFARAQRNFMRSLAGYSVITYLLQIKDRHNGNILLDREGHLIHIDFGFMLSNTPGNIGFEAAPFKFPLEYLEVLGGSGSACYAEFRKLFREGFEAARKHADSIVTLVELMQKDSTMPCFVVSGEQTAAQLRERFQPTLTHSLVGEAVDRLIDSSIGSHWTRLYDSFQYYSQSIL